MNLMQEQLFFLHAAQKRRDRTIKEQRQQHELDEHTHRCLQNTIDEQKRQLARQETQIQETKRFLGQFSHVVKELEKDPPTND